MHRVWSGIFSQPVTSGSVSQAAWCQDAIGATTQPATSAGRVATPSSAQSRSIFASFASESSPEPRSLQRSWLPTTNATDAKLAAPDRIEFVGKAYFDVPNDVPIVRKEVCVSILKKDRVLTAWASAPVDTIASNSEVSRFLPAIIATFRA